MIGQDIRVDVFACDTPCNYAPLIKHNRVFSQPERTVHYIGIIGMARLQQCPMIGKMPGCVFGKPVFEQ